MTESLQACSLVMIVMFLLNEISIIISYFYVYGEADRLLFAHEYSLAITIIFPNYITHDLLINIMHSYICALSTFSVLIKATFTLLRYHCCPR